ncbi:drug/metabolite exporter YedA [Variovorax dokdonensis]|uniref:Drug/metabolite exporter YedA n=1 Tax=Variovorax dokdonensis TaxID=344883 RepID=A0ABT7N7X4_9BURK|nr:drug/metabolite exporter YedA [Variovorax dokdonensis]MDM0044028.1 drug/metabolite exporter YedA [Variovorax dokdonensis]
MSSPTTLVASKARAPQSPRSSGRLGLSPLLWLCLAATWLVWGSTYLAIKVALTSFPPFLQMGSRFLVAGALLAAWMRWRGAPWPNRRQWLHAWVIGALMLGGGMGGVAHAELTVGSGLVVAFIAVLPMMIALLNRLWGIRPSRLETAGIVVGLIGVLLLTQGSGFQASPAGLLAICIACAAWSLGSVLSQRSLPLASGAMGFASEMLCGGVVLMLLAAASGERLQWPFAIEAVGAWIYLVVFGSLVAFNAYMVLLARAPAGLAASYSFVNPVIAMLLGMWLGGETVTRFEWLAVGVVLAGVMLLLANHARPPTPPDAQR